MVRPMLVTLRISSTLTSQLVLLAMYLLEFIIVQYEWSFWLRLQLKLMNASRSVWTVEGTLALPGRRRRIKINHVI